MSCTFEVKEHLEAVSMHLIHHRRLSVAIKSVMPTLTQRAWPARRSASSSLFLGAIKRNTRARVPAHLLLQYSQIAPNQLMDVRYTPGFFAQSSFLRVQNTERNIGSKHLQNPPRQLRRPQDKLCSILAQPCRRQRRDRTGRTAPPPDHTTAAL